ncbi:hypothetical protein ACTXT7_009607 [Hymenolepis weldensis]
MRPADGTMYKKSSKKHLINLPRKFVALSEDNKAATKSLHAEIKLLLQKLRLKISPNVSLNSNKHSTQRLVISVSPKVLPTAIPVQVTNDDANLYSSARDINESRELCEIFHA